MFPTYWFASVLLAGSVSAQQVSYEHDGTGWLRKEGELVYRVDPRVVTARTAVDRDVAAILKSLGGSVAGARMIRENRLGFRDILIPEGRDVLEFVSRLKKTGLFSLVEENTIGRFTGSTCATPATPTFADQWNLNNTGQSGGTVDADIDALEAWAYEDGDPAIVVAIVDSGTNWNHEDLDGNIWSNADEVLDGTDTDSNGFVDDVRGWDFEAADNAPEGIFWHGTATASVVSARGQNGLGIDGVAGGATDGLGVSIMPVKVGNFFPLSETLDDAILYAVDNGADIINLSLGVGFSSSIVAALADAQSNDVLVIAAAGDDVSSTVHFPANQPDVMAVTATSHFDVVINVSNFGPEIDVAAPGDEIPVCHLGTTDYFIACGSSFAAPHVAGLAALLLSVKESLTNAELREYIVDAADDIEAMGEDIFSGAGRINANASLVNLAVGYAKVYGVGTGGTSTVPGMVASGVPTIGEIFISSTFNALPGGFAALGFSSQSALIPFLGGFLNIHPAGMLLFPTTIDGAGDGFRSFPIPNDTAFIARERFLQWFILDPGAPGGLAMSQGMHLKVASP
jgi:subtilisin family serine protease